MNRRKFLQLFGTGIASLALPKSIITSASEDSTFAFYKNRSIMDAGYLYCPYIPIIATTTIMGSNNV